jgi:hypothetical protein
MSPTDLDDPTGPSVTALRPAVAARRAGERHRPPSPFTRDVQKWSRLLHVYTSMIALVVILFFGLTGLTLNHPAWTLGDGLTRSTATGTMPMPVVLADGSVDYLGLSEFVRGTHGVRGTVDSFDTVQGEASIAYKNPGYSAEVFVDVATGAYELKVEQQGWVAVLNDLHKGRDAGSGWSWVIDVSAGFLVVVSLTGLVMQLVLRKRRTSALAFLAGGGVVTVLLTWLTLR